MKGRKPSLQTIASRAVYQGDPPVCPDWLDEVAKAEWLRIVREMTAAGSPVTPADRASLAAYCQVYSQWRQAEEQVRRDGIMIPGSKGNMVLHPCARHVGSLLTIMIRVAGEFGFTPAARARSKAPPAIDPESEDFERFTTT